VTAHPAPRSSCEGYPCPPWRTTGHDEVHGGAGPSGFHGSAPAAIPLRGDSAGARAMRDSTWHDEPATLITGLDRAADPALQAGPRHAEHLAGLAEMLAGAPVSAPGAGRGDPRGGRGNRGGHTGAHAPEAARLRGEHPPRWFR
jgi:hypothetical protein